MLKMLELHCLFPMRDNRLLTIKSNPCSESYPQIDRNETAKKYPDS